MTRIVPLVVLLAAGATSIACSNLEGPVQPSSFSSDLASSPTWSASTPGSNTPLSGAPAATARASSCSLVANGVDVMVAGARAAGGAVVATHVIKAPERMGEGTGVLTPAPATPPAGAVPGSRMSVAARGPATHVMGTCPDLVFEVDGVAVVTTGATVFFE